MERIFGMAGEDTGLPCPLCVAQGNVTDSGFTPHLLRTDDAGEVAYRCPAVHGVLGTGEARRHGLHDSGTPVADGR